MAANPFLFTEDDYVSPSATASNPFLMTGEDDFPSTAHNDNPFLSQCATTMAPTQDAVGTNPFAFDPMDLEPSEAQPAIFQQTFNVFTEASTVNQHFIIDSNAALMPQKPTDLDLKYTNSITQEVDMGEESGPRRPPPPARPPPSKETQDLLMSVVGEIDAASSHLLDRIPPTRTPSPVSMRDLHSPSPTPEPHFGDLLDVSDAKTETTGHHHQVPSAQDDLLMLSDDGNDINQNESQNIFMQSQPMIHEPVQTFQPVQPMQPVQPVQPIQPVPSQQQPSYNPPRPVVPPSRPAPPMRPAPPRPAPPQKPPPPVIRPVQPQPPPHPQPPPAIPPQPVPINQMAAPPKPPPPVIPHAPPSVPQAPPKTDDVDMFGPQAAPKSAADILNLYKKGPAPMDLLSDVLAGPATERTETSESNSRKSSVPSEHSVIQNAPTEIEVEPQLELQSEGVDFPADELQPDIVQKTPKETSLQMVSQVESYLSPQQDTQMDTSDSQSKESVSSATFNPFAAVEETSPTNPSAVPTQDFSTIMEHQPTESKLDNYQAQKQDQYLDNSAFQPPAMPIVTTSSNIFTSTSNVSTMPTNKTDAFGSSVAPKTHPTPSGLSANEDAFDAFAAKFESAKDENRNGAFDAFGGDTWGLEAGNIGFESGGFGNEETFDSFLAMQEPPSVPQSTPYKMSQAGSLESDDEKDFSVVIRPKMADDGFGSALPVLAPPPPTTNLAYADPSRINPFDQSGEVTTSIVPPQDIAIPVGEMKRTDSQETPPTPLYDDDVSQPLEPFPRVHFAQEGWEMHLRQPNKKKITGQRFWKKIFVKLHYQPDCILLQLFNQQNDKDPFQELPLQPCYSVSEIGAQQYDNFGKIFTVKLQYIFYKERPGVRPGQVKKAERITNKLSKFAQYAIQGDYEGCKEFGSDLKKLGLPVEHAPQVSQLMKIGSLNFEDLKQFSVTIEEALFKLQAHRDRALNYKMEEVQVTAVDELYVEQDADGHIDRQIARVRLFFLGFLTGMPDIELGVNDMRRQGKEVVGRHDIIPVATEEWIRLEDVEFHNCVQQEDYNATHILKFKPPDACYIELLRFRVRPPKNRELPLQLKAQICVTGYRIELRADVLVPGFASRKLGQVPCEDVMIRFPIPECWIYMFRVEKHFRYGSVKSAHRRTGKIKGIERILGTVDQVQESLIEVTSGQAKYEHQHRAIVWRCPRLPKEGQGAYTTHNMVCRISLTSYDQMPDQLADYCYVEFTMPATQVSHTTVRSVSLQNSDSDEPPEKYVRYLARHEYRVGIEHTEGSAPNAYSVATRVTKPPEEEKPKPIPEAESSSDSE